MKSEFELYMETGMVGAYQPEMAVLRKEPDGVLAVYRDTVFEQHDGWRPALSHHLCISGHGIF